MRIIVQYLTQSLQKRTDRITLPAKSTTDQLFECLSKKYAKPINRLDIKYKRDGFNVNQTLARARW